MDKPEMERKAKELTAACKKLHPRISCKVSNIIKDYVTVLGETSQTKNESNSDKIYAYIQIPSDFPKAEIPPIEQLLKQLYSFDYVARVFLEFVQS
jgi:hypothetical protein